MSEKVGNRNAVLNNAIGYGALGAAVGAGSSAKGYCKINKALKAISSDSFNLQEDVKKVSVNLANKRDIYEIAGLKNFKINVDEGVQVTKELLTDAMQEAKKMIKKQKAPKAMLQFGVAFATLGILIGLAKKDIANSENKQ